MPSDEASALVHAIVCEIRLYLLRNPQAKDTAGGIHRWWIPAGEERFTREDVQSALDYMVRRGWAQKSFIADTVLYSAAAPGTGQAVDDAQGTRDPVDEN